MAKLIRALLIAICLGAVGHAQVSVYPPPASGGGLPQLVAQVSATNQTTAISQTPIFTTTVAGIYRISTSVVITVASTSGGTFFPGNFYSAVTGGAQMGSTSPSVAATAAGNAQTNTNIFWCDVGQQIKYYVNFSGATAGTAYKMYSVLERVQ